MKEIVGRMKTRILTENKATLKKKKRVSPKKLLQQNKNGRRKKRNNKTKHRRNELKTQTLNKEIYHE